MTHPTVSRSKVDAHEITPNEIAPFPPIQQKKGYSTDDTLSDAKKPQSMFFRAYNYLESIFIERYRESIQSMEDSMEITALEMDPNSLHYQVSNSRNNSRLWVDNELAKIRELLDSDDVNVDNIVKYATSIADLASFQSAQEEHNEITELRRQLKILLEEQQKKYTDMKIFGVDAITATLGAAATVMGGSTEVFQTITAGGQAISKVGGNHLEGGKTAIQHVIEAIKQHMEQSRNNRGAFDNTSTKLHDQLLQMQQALHQLRLEMIRG